MKVILSSNIDHYRYTAQALQNNKFNIKFISGALYTKKPWYYNYSGRLKPWIDNRIEKSIASNNIRSLKLYEILYKKIRNSGVITKFISKRKIDKIFNNIFDYNCKFYLKKNNDLDIFHYVSSIGYKSASYLNKKNKQVKIIVDDRAEHKGFLYSMLIEEYDKLGITFDDKEFWTIDCRRDYDLADYIITPSKFSKNTFVSQGIDEHKLVVIPYGCNTKDFYPQKIKNDDGIFRIIYVGSLCVRKGAQYLIDAFKNIDVDNIELLIIGKIEKELEHIFKDIPQNIKMIDYVPNKELNTYYSNSDVFVLPSLSDSFSLATLEAMSAGLPVIISENVGAKDFVEHGKNGYIVPIRDSNSIRENILKLYKNRELAKLMGKKARESVLNVTWQNYEDEIIKLYNNISS